jgi:hypothetical protein
MKKILFLASLLLVTDSLFANPVVAPQALISEFMFATNNKWELEISFAGTTDTYIHSEYDSICVVTSAGIARIKLDFIEDGTSLLVITPDSLIAPLSVNSTGDCIKLYTYGSVYTHLLVDSVSFGNYLGSMCDSIPTGYSICKVGGFFCLNKNPTIGTPNDTTGCCAALTGFIFNQNSKKVGGINFTLNYPLTFNPDSTYSTRILAQKCILSTIVEVVGPSSMYWLRTNPVDIDAYPDSIVKDDIYLVDPVGIRETPVPPNPDLYIINYPNPFNPGTNFYVRIPESLKHKEGQIEIYNSIGQKIFVVPISSGSSYKWNGAGMSGKVVSSGVYYYRLVFGNAVYKTGSMILLK